MYPTKVHQLEWVKFDFSLTPCVLINILYKTVWITFRRRTRKKLRGRTDCLPDSQTWSFLFLSSDIICLLSSNRRSLIFCLLHSALWPNVTIVSLDDYYIVTIITSISIYPVSLQNQICFLVNGVGVFRACGGEGESDDQGVFCTTGPYFHVQDNGFDLCLCYLSVVVNLWPVFLIRDVGVMETSAITRPTTLSCSPTQQQQHVRQQQRQPSAKLMQHKKLKQLQRSKQQAKPETVEIKISTQRKVFQFSALTN